MLIEQLKYFPKGLHDDGPDALEMAYQVAKEGRSKIWTAHLKNGRLI